MQNCSEQRKQSTVLLMMLLWTAVLQLQMRLQLVHWLHSIPLVVVSLPPWSPDLLVPRTPLFAAAPRLAWRSVLLVRQAVQVVQAAPAASMMAQGPEALKRVPAMISQELRKSPSPSVEPLVLVWAHQELVARASLEEWLSLSQVRC